MKYVSTVNGNEYLIEIIDERHIIVNGRKYTVDFNSVSGQPIYSLLLGGRSFEGFVYPGEDTWEVLLMGRQFPILVEDEREKRLRAAAGGTLSDSGEYHLRAPMPGMVVSIPVQDGQEIEKGQVLVILESMKMQNELQSPRDGVVTRLKIDRGASVERHELICYVGNPK